MENKKKKLIKYFYQVMGDERFLEVLKGYSNGEGYGIEHVWCVFADDYEEWEDEYFGEEGIAYYFDYPAVEEDEEVILDYHTFYIYLKDACESYLDRHPNDEKQVKEYLEQIKDRFTIK
ncbi:ribonuclease toxin immunity protein CdiI [Bacillus arachidis]|uniref:CDI immunity protein domain-containing protein n=1 Tax=Bacillus arachidis TaxID=2819290 RepID=A0ABS3NXH1_9BACI|nr:ribonuclease toxin immunity protein CdiI [Bacillus arachidis]MBO1625275.1 hypothetical protein [Bacillus arachidis]